LAVPHLPCQVQLRLLRLREQATDLLITLSRPVDATPNASGKEQAAAVDDGSAAAAADAEMVTAVMQSLEIHDWGLFGASG
jgi:hypothetical protein